MKKYFIILLLIFLSIDVAAVNEIRIHHNGQMPTHSEYYPPADMPEVYYDDDVMEIILVADGFASYYYVEIFQTGYTVPAISTQVDGYGDTVDISSLPDGNYTLVITSEYNNVYEGQFAIE